LDHPVKKFKPNEKLPEKARPFESFTPATQAGLVNPTMAVQPMEVKQEAAMGVSSFNIINPHPHC
jgi:hypothetical protein